MPGPLPGPQGGITGISSDAPALRGVGTEGSLVEGRDEPVGDCVEESAPEWWPYSSLLRSASASAAVRLATDEPRNAFLS